MDKIKNIINKCLINNGCNIDIDKNIKHVKGGYMISLYNHETIVSNPSNIMEVKKAIDKKIDTIKELKKVNHKSKFYIGLWMFENNLYIDISINVLSYKKAVEIGVNNKQYCIYDVKNNCDVKLQKDVYILYKYNHVNNDLQYIHEYINYKDVLNYLNISKNHFYNLVQKDIDVFDNSKLFKNKIAIIKDKAYTRDLQF